MSLLCVDFTLNGSRQNICPSNGNICLLTQASLQEQTPILQHTGVKPDIDTPTTDKPKTIGGNK